MVCDNCGEDTGDWIRHGIWYLCSYCWGIEYGPLERREYYRAKHKDLEAKRRTDAKG